MAMKKAIFLDINTLISEKKNVDNYIAEAIKDVYGVDASSTVQNFISDTAQASVRAMLSSKGIPEEEIKPKIGMAMEFLQYSYYNTAGHDGIILNPGARDLVTKLSKDSSVLYVVSGEPEKIIENKLKRAGMEHVFAGVISGTGSATFSEMCSEMLKVAGSAGVQPEGTWLLTSIPKFISAASSLGMATIGLSVIQNDMDILKASGARYIFRNLKERKLYGLLLE
jgi:beta-phosphoglucomutase-like phosphatase (HAD superfamily)